MATKLKDSYICKGPRLKGAKEIAIAQKRLLHENARAFQRSNKAPEEIAAALARIEHDFLADPRKRCGYRMNDVLEALPEDGLEYDAVCPQCGTVTATKRTPPDPVPEPATV